MKTEKFEYIRHLENRLFFVDHRTTCVSLEIYGYFSPQDNRILPFVEALSGLIVPLTSKHYSRTGHNRFMIQSSGRKNCVNPQ